MSGIVISGLIQRSVCGLMALAVGATLSVSPSMGQTMAEQAAEDGILLLGNGNEPKALDPHLVSGVVESNLLRSLFEGLCIEHPSDDSASLPGAAASWSANEDFTQWTFQLQPEGKWSDGTPVTAQDFVFAYERILHPDFPSGYADMLYFIQNAEGFHKGKVADFAQVGVKAIDDYTLQISLKAPTPFLPSLTKHFTWLPVPRHAILQYGTMTEPYTAWTHQGNLVSNGAFQLKTWRQNHYIEVERNPHYWEKDAIALNGIRYFPIKNANTETRMFLNGQLHVTYTIPPDYIPTALTRYPQQTKQETYIGTRFMRANHKREFTSDPLVRQALSLCIDRQSLIDNILQGGQKPAGSCTPPFGQYNPAFMTAFDPAKAVELLRQAGHEPGQLPELELLTTDSDTNRRMAEAMQALWREHLGLKVRIVQREWKSYLKLRKDLEFDLMDGGWIGDYMDPTTFLDLWKEHNGNNNTGWGAPAYEAILAEAELIEDPAARYAKLLEAEAYVMEHTPAIPVYHYNTNYLLSPLVQNWHPLLLNTHPYKFVALQPQD